MSNLWTFFFVFPTLRHWHLSMNKWDLFDLPVTVVIQLQETKLDSTWFYLWIKSIVSCNRTVERRQSPGVLNSWVLFLFLFLSLCCPPQLFHLVLLVVLRILPSSLLFHSLIRLPWVCLPLKQRWSLWISRSWLVMEVECMLGSHICLLLAYLISKWGAFNEYFPVLSLDDGVGF